MPILLHDDCLALLKCLNNDIRLDIYLDTEMQAKGGLYLDDGTSFDYMDRQSGSIRLQFDFVDGVFTAKFVHGDSYDQVPDFASVVIYGIAKEPESVTNSEGNIISYFYDSVK